MSFLGNLGHDFKVGFGIAAKAVTTTDTVLQSPIVQAIAGMFPAAAPAIRLEHMIASKVTEAEVLFAGIPKSGVQKEAWVIDQSQAVLDFGLEIVNDIEGTQGKSVQFDTGLVKQIIAAVVQVKNLSQQAASSAKVIPATIPQVVAG